MTVKDGMVVDEIILEGEFIEIVVNEVPQQKIKTKKKLMNYFHIESEDDLLFFKQFDSNKKQGKKNIILKFFKPSRALHHYQKWLADPELSDLRITPKIPV